MQRRPLQLKTQLLQKEIVSVHLFHSNLLNESKLSLPYYRDSGGRAVFVKPI